jgi:hypothetical protein
MDKASSPHHKSMVLKYFEKNKCGLVHVYLPTIASPEFMVMEETGDIAKRDLLVLNYYASFSDLSNKFSTYVRTKRFNLNMRNYLLRDIF